MGGKKSKQKPPISVASATKTASGPGSGGIDYEFKLLTIGDAGVGKSSFTMRICKNEFTESFISSIGADFLVYNTEVGGKNIKVNMWDTAGQERFRTITSSYYRGANILLLVFDLTSTESFNNIRKWHSESERYSDGSVIRMVIGNKSDDATNRRVRPEEAEEFANSHGLLYEETSAKNGSNCAAALAKAIQLCIEDIEK